MDRVDRNCLSYWFTRLVAAGVPVPRTEIVRWPGDPWELTCLCDGKTPPGFAVFVAGLAAAAERVGPYPCFLRTGQGSGKHGWKDCCFVPDAASLPARVAALVEWSHLVDMLGLAHDVWAVRELLPTRPLARLPLYGDFPLVPEVRAFVRGGRVICHHSYWPAGSIADGRERHYRGRLLEGDAEPGPHPSAGIADVLARGCEDFIARHEAEWRPLAEKVAAAFAGDGAWSVDILPTNGRFADREWFVTDMAEAGRSFHWPGCEHEKAFARP